MVKRSITVGAGTKLSLINNFRNLVLYGYLEMEAGNYTKARDLYRALNLYIEVMTLDEFCDALSDEFGEMFDSLDGFMFDFIG